MWRMPWNRHRVEARAEADRALVALELARADIHEREILVQDLHRIHRENHLAPKLVEAFRLASRRAR